MLWSMSIESKAAEPEPFSMYDGSASVKTGSTLVSGLYYGRSNVYLENPTFLTVGESYTITVSFDVSGFGTPYSNGDVFNLTIPDGSLIGKTYSFKNSSLTETFNFTYGVSEYCSKFTLVPFAYSSSPNVSITGNINVKLLSCKDSSGTELLNVPSGSGDGDWHTLPDVVYHVKSSGSYTFGENDIVSPVSYGSGSGATVIPDINPGSTYTLEFVHSNTVSKSVGIPTVTLGFLSYTNDVSGTNFSKSYNSLGGSTEQVTFTAQDGIVLFTSANSSSLVASDFGVGECAWSYDVTHTISNIRYKRVMDQDTLDKIEDNTGRGADAAEETAETTKGIWETIKEFFGGFFNNLIESIVHLFVPTSEEMSGLFDELNQFFSDTFGFLYAPFDYLIQLIGVFTSSSGSTGLVFPGFSIMGHEVWPDMTYDISSDPVAGKVLEYVRIGTGVLLAGWFIMYLQDFFKEKFGSGGA